MSNKPGFFQIFRAAFGTSAVVGTVLAALSVAGGLPFTLPSVAAAVLACTALASVPAALLTAVGLGLARQLGWKTAGACAATVGAGILCMAAGSALERRTGAFDTAPDLGTEAARAFAPAPAGASIPSAISFSVPPVTVTAAADRPASA